MKTTVKVLVILFALAMNVTNVRADGAPKPVVVKTTKPTPLVGGNPGPKRGRSTVEILNIDILLDQENRSLSFYDPEGRTITYYIYDEDEFEVASGTISFATTEEATVSLEDLEDGIYTLCIECNNTTYEGEFGLEE